MTRRSKARRLTLWANGVHVGVWEVSNKGEDVLRYDPAWIQSPQGRALNHTATLCGWGNGMEDLIQEELQRLPTALDHTAGELSAEFPAVVFDTIKYGVLGTLSWTHRVWRQSK